MIFGFHTELPLVVGPDPDQDPRPYPWRRDRYDLCDPLGLAPRRRRPRDAPLPRIGVWISCEFTLTV